MPLKVNREKLLESVSDHLTFYCFCPDYTL
jgi:hypothetical protein